MTHVDYIRRAIALAALADGRTHPNPMVGAVVVRRGRVLGEGFHRQAGLPHAEVEALAQAGRGARGADLYVTLEPCCHYGRTPPCTEAIVRAGIRRVIFGMRDPDRRVRGKGLRQLRAAGIRVIGPVGARECRALNPAFCHWAATGHPYVIVKVGASLDGMIADVEGQSRWITNAATREYVHAVRARVDGIVIGRHTVTRDDPQLTVRLPHFTGPQPRPIILVGRGRIPRRARLVRNGVRRPACWVIPRQRERELAWLARAGHDLLVCPMRRGQFDLRWLLHTLGRQGMGSLMVEGGGSTIGAFFRAGYVDYVVVGLAPMILGGKALGWTKHLTIPSLRRAGRLQVAAMRRFGDNVVVEGRVRS